MWDDTIQINISDKWLNHLFSCNMDYIQNVCNGGCCEGNNCIVVSLLPEEESTQKQHGYNVENGMLQAVNKKCPHKNENGLCNVHDTNLKPFGCIVSPFTLSKSKGKKTLIIRHRYSRRKCHGHGEPAYITFKKSLNLLFGLEESNRICKELENKKSNIVGNIPTEVYDNLLYLDSLKKVQETKKNKRSATCTIKKIMTQ